MNQAQKDAACAAGCVTILMLLVKLAFLGFLAFLAYVLVMHYAG